MINFDEIKKSFLTSIWFMFLTFPVMVIRVNTVENIIEWRWHYLIKVGIGSFFLSYIWRYLLKLKEEGKSPADTKEQPLWNYLLKVGSGNSPLSFVLRYLLKLRSIGKQLFNKKEQPLIQHITQEPKIYFPLLFIVSVISVAYPFVFSMYHTNIMINALIFVVLGLGLNIVVGLAGLLDLGYVAFYAVGAYAYALLNQHFGMGFWMALPIGALLGALFGIILGYPVLRLRGDYLAIVTLGFGEIIRMVLENWSEFSNGPSGIANIPPPSLFGIQFSLTGIYFLMIFLVLFTIFVVNRLQNSRIGRAWIALREDEVACQAMGIDKARTKLTAFALGATWAGMAGVVFAAKTRFINPPCFTLWESIIILCIVVLGGMGSIPGVIIGALVLKLLPEYLKAFDDMRMLLYGAALVVMMVFRPGGIIPDIRKAYEFKKKTEE